VQIELQKYRNPVSCASDHQAHGDQQKESTTEKRLEPTAK
jgi:hypothetical protein